MVALGDHQTVWSHLLVRFESDLLVSHCSCVKCLYGFNAIDVSSQALTPATSAIDIQAGNWQQSTGEPLTVTWPKIFDIDRFSQPTNRPRELMTC